MIELREYAEGTYMRSRLPWGDYTAARVMCSDGVVRNVKRIAQTADTFFSIPAAVTVKGKTVSGYVTIETVKGNSVVTDDDPAMVKFIAHQYGKNGDLLPPGAWRQPRDHDYMQPEGQHISAGCQECGDIVERHQDWPKYRQQGAGWVKDEPTNNQEGA